MAIITGTNGDDPQLNGTNLADEIYALAGNDGLIGFGGNDILIGYDGDDVLEGGAGADELFGSAGFDYASYKGSPAGVSILLRNSPVTSAPPAVGRLTLEGLRGSLPREAFELVVAALPSRACEVVAERPSRATDRPSGEVVAHCVAGAWARVVQQDCNTASFYNTGGSAVVADLVSGTATGGDLIGNDRLSSIENLQGSIYNDRLAGNGGANRLQGLGGGDVLVGRGGADRFVYSDRYDSNPKAPDSILDFSHSQGDRIDLREIDANEQVDGNQAFQFIGQAQSTVAGQVRFFQSGGDTYIDVDTSNAIAGAELRIVLDPLFSPQASDFVL